MNFWIMVPFPTPLGPQTTSGSNTMLADDCLSEENVSASTSRWLDDRDRAIRDLIATKESVRRGTTDKKIMINDNVSTLDHILSRC
jgi:hypothetical protein